MAGDPCRECPQSSNRGMRMILIRSVVGALPLALDARRSARLQLLVMLRCGDRFGSTVPFRRLMAQFPRRSSDVASPSSMAVGKPLRGRKRATMTGNHKIFGHCDWRQQASWIGLVEKLTCGYDPCHNTRAVAACMDAPSAVTQSAALKILTVKPLN